MKMVCGQAELLEVVGALHAVGGLAHLLHRREQEADEDGDDGDHHQQLNQREGAPAGVGVRAKHETNPPQKECSLHWPRSPGTWAGASRGGGVFQIFTVPSRLAEAIHLPSGLKARLSTQLLWPRRLWIALVCSSQILTVASVLPQARSRPSGLNARLSTPPAVGLRSSCCCFQVRVSQSLMVPSMLADARSSPSARNARQLGRLGWSGWRVRR